MRKEIGVFCTECREKSQYEKKKVKRIFNIREKNYEFEVTAVFCKKCGEEVNIPGIMDIRANEIDEQYRTIENIISISDIESLMEIYNIGKGPLSLTLGFGEITITRYLQGQVPSKEYSDVIRKALESPNYMIEQLNMYKDKIGDVAYKKSMKAAEELKELFVVSNKMLLTISYIFERVQEITPLALQKILYYIQGIYMVCFGKPLYEEDCQAWVHGPAYETVYNMFRTFKYHTIEDRRFAIFKNRFHELDMDEKRIIDLVIDTFGMYSGKILELITHAEEPWKKAREGYLPTEASKEIISKESIREYFENVSKEFDVECVEEIESYIRKQLKSILGTC